ncbi:MAG: insulinase family protein, partial [Rhodothermaceae bacterium]|nr:insulinase family protein [Rhodothermaceae bacterium]
FHVGSARELPGRTGFAHLFEHLLFLDSENLGYGGLDRLSSRVGGAGANGSTSRDRTNYFQTVPNDALEKMIWAEAEKLGFFINTVSEVVLEKEKQVVKNEKRQSYDNRPYGHEGYVTDKHLYPADHPYSWQVIGSLEDLQAATLEDVVNFYNTWYVPNNATLVIAGDFDSAQAREWVEKYFGEIPRGADIEPLEVRHASLEDDIRLLHEDNFARLPLFTVTWPGVENYHPDSYALDMLSSLLTDGKRSPFYQVIVEEKKLAPGVNMYNGTSEIAGEYTLSIRAFADTDLNEVRAAMDEAFARFEEDGFTAADLDRIKAGRETAFYNRLTSVLGKAFQLAQYNIFAGDPGFITRDLENILAVTPEDVMRVYEQYIKGKPTVSTSFVPRGQADLALAGSVRADVVEEEIVIGAEAEVNPEAEVAFEHTPSSFDRSVEPPFGPEPELRIPDVWVADLANGLDIYGIVYDEVPIVQFELRLKGGMLLDDPAKVGVASLTAEMMNRGTRNRTPSELEDAIDQLGSRIRVSANAQTFTISGNSLARNFDQTMALVTEILLEPRWDENEFGLARQQALSTITQRESNPGSIASDQFSRLVYGDEHILANHPGGTAESVEAITINDLKNYYDAAISPEVAVFHIVGDVARNDVLTSISGLENGWTNRAVTFPEYPMAEAPASPALWFYDVPGASQSQIRFGYPALAETHPDYFAADVMNFTLGGGGFVSRLMQELREGKGYTYGISSWFSGTDLPGPFMISTGVRANVTLESAELIRQIVRDYPSTFTEDDLENTKSNLLKSNARAFETPGAKLAMLRNMSTYGWPADYVLQQEEVIRNMTVERIRELARQYADPERMHYLIAGDAATQLERLRTLGLGDPVMLE